MRRSRLSSPPSQPTIDDVARLAGVSIATVSNVLSGTRRVRPQTKDRVEAAVSELGYRPNRVAQALIRQRTHGIGMILPDVSNPFFSVLLRGVEDVLGEADYAVVVGSSDNNAAKALRYIAAFRDRRLDGIILDMALDVDPETIFLINEEIPIILIDRLIPDWQGDSVTGDDRTGMGLAVGHLVALGHRSIALINGDVAVSSASLRLAGFMNSLRKHGLRPVEVSEGSFTLESGYEQTRRILALPQQPTGICAGNDLLALGALTAIREVGLRVPEDVSVVGYDDIEYARLAWPRLTTIRQPAREMGNLAARLMLERLSGEQKPGRRVVLEPKLVVRSSSAPPARK